MAKKCIHSEEQKWMSLAMAWPMADEKSDKRTGDRMCHLCACERWAF
jgi:hypothetical protein